MADTSADPKQNPLPLDPRLQAYLQDIMNLSVTRQEDQYPLHQAAMAMATRMAPGYAQNAMTMAPKRTDPNNTKSLTGGPLGDGGGSGTAQTVLMTALLALLNGGGAGSKDIGQSLRDLVDKFRNRDQRQMDFSRPYPGGAMTGDGGGDFSDPADPHTVGDNRTGPRSQIGARWWVGSGLAPGLTLHDFLNDPAKLNSLLAGLQSDPSGGTGVGPGMQRYYDDYSGGR